MGVRSVFPPRAVFQSATPADRASRRSRSPSVVRACACVHACARERGAMQRGAMHFGRVRALPKRLPVARGDSASKLVTGPLGRSGPQVLCRRTQRTRHAPRYNATTSATGDSPYMRGHSAVLWGQAPPSPARPKCHFSRPPRARYCLSDGARARSARGCGVGSHAAVEVTAGTLQLEPCQTSRAKTVRRDSLGLVPALASSVGMPEPDGAKSALLPERYSGRTHLARGWW